MQAVIEEQAENVKAKLSFRYGLDVYARTGLIVWSCGWLVILASMLYYGEINSMQTTYTRTESPFWYWGTAIVAAGLAIFGLILTFEISDVETEERGES